MYKYLLLSMVCVIVAGGCSSDPDGKGRSYISQSYYEWLIDANRFNAYQSMQGADKASAISIVFKGRRYSADNPEHFDKCWVPAGDTNWYGKRNTSLGPGPTAVMNQFTSVSITCDKDYDGSHPAGSDLGDIVKYWCGSGGLYIDSGYEDESGMVVDKFLKDLTLTDLRLICDFPGSFMYFVSPPLGKEYTFTITFHQDAGDLTATVDFNFQ